MFNGSVSQLKNVDKLHYTLLSNVHVEEKGGLVGVVLDECKHGYHSERGEPCRPCSEGSYGRKCADICNCEENYRCDHVVGCTKEKLDTTFPPVKGLLVREIFIYTLVPITFLIIVVVSVLCIRYYKQRSSNNSIGQQNNVVEQRMERRYDSIDEINMSDILPQNINTINNSNEPNIEMKNDENPSAGYLNPVLSDTDSLMNSTSEEGGHSESSDTENTVRGSGYLHPYQPIVTDEDVHKYDSKTNDEDITDSKLKVVVPYQSELSELHEIKEDSISLNSTNIDHSES
ncbi:unnamed protein product [Mytilus coruscus]|uniref:MEGF10_11 n=1 Tax=Mytilus coruscus TaxID=42192 RepID=A0A6J8DQT5_MYTCO|nr:unnamed protein product [Mytilus coruscus]